MKDNGFQEGVITYSVEDKMPAELAAELAKNVWSDGYIAFADSEKKLADAEAALSGEQLGNRVSGIAGATGYVMEINLWRQQENILHEMVAEREDDHFFVQTWRLDTAPEPGSGNCWHKEAGTKTGSHHRGDKCLFLGTLKTVEVVWPAHRLNFFITRGEE